MPYEKTLIDKLVLGISSALGDVSTWDKDNNAAKFLEKIGITLNGDFNITGTNFSSSVKQFGDLLKTVENYEDKLLNESLDVDAMYTLFTTMATELAKTISAIPTLYSNIKDDITIIGIDGIPDDFSDEFIKRFIDYALVNYCRNSYPAIYGILLVVGVIDKTDDITKFHFDRLLQIFKNPSNLINDVYYDNGDLRLEKIITNVISIALSFNKSE